ncbi:MAG: hypothetical protein ACQESR_28995, partial [Planctomycetota bacterium]
MIRLSVVACHAVLLVLGLSPSAWGQTTSVHVHHHHPPARPLAANVIIPQRAVISSSPRASRSIAPRSERNDTVRIERVDVSVS